MFRIDVYPPGTVFDSRKTGPSGRYPPSRQRGGHPYQKIPSSFADFSNFFDGIGFDLTADDASASPRRSLSPSSRRFFFISSALRPIHSIHSFSTKPGSQSIRISPSSTSCTFFKTPQFSSLAGSPSRPPWSPFTEFPSTTQPSFLERNH